MNNEIQTPAILSHLEQQARNAHNNISFSPERRGSQMIADYSEELTADMEELKAQGATDESVSDYKNRYERYFTSYLSAKGRCFSSFITGPANFPVRRHEKTQRSEENHYNIFREWRTRAKKAIVRKLQPVKTFISEIDRYRSDLEGMKKNHEIMKACNSIIKKAKGSDCTAQLITAGLSEAIARKIQLPDFAGRIGFASFNLTNNNANMKRVEERIKELEAKEGMREESPITNYTFEGGEMVINYEIDRIQIIFATKPTNEELTAWKAKGLNTFNWSPSAKAWQRKITANALRCVKSMLTGITKVTNHKAKDETIRELLEALNKVIQLQYEPGRSRPYIDTILSIVKTAIAKHNQ